MMQHQQRSPNHKDVYTDQFMEGVDIAIIHGKDKTPKAFLNGVNVNAETSMLREKLDQSSKELEQKEQEIIELKKANAELINNCKTCADKVTKEMLVNLNVEQTKLWNTVNTVNEDLKTRKTLLEREVESYKADVDRLQKECKGLHETLGKTQQFLRSAENQQQSDKIAYDLMIKGKAELLEKVKRLEKIQKDTVSRTLYNTEIKDRDAEIKKLQEQLKQTVKHPDIITLENKIEELEKESLAHLKAKIELEKENKTLKRSNAAHKAHSTRNKRK